MNESEISKNASSSGNFFYSWAGSTWDKVWAERRMIESRCRDESKDRDEKKSRDENKLLERMGG